jgi:hypothetical protein
LPDCWLEVSIRKVLRPATSAQVFLGFPASKSECWDSSQDSKLLLHASHVALPIEISYILISHVCICIITTATVRQPTCSYINYYYYKSLRNLSVFRHIRKTAKSNYKLRHACLSFCLSAYSSVRPSVRPSVRLHETTRLPLNGFSRSLNVFFDTPRSNNIPYQNQLLCTILCIFPHNNFLSVAFGHPVMSSGRSAFIVVSSPILPNDKFL